MRKFFLSLFTAIMALGFVGCEYDDSALWGEVNSLKDRVLTLEQLCQQMNTNISSLQSLVSALQNQDYITSVTPIKQGNDVIGYTITFAKGEPITIYHGQDGKNGADGEDGKDGYTPVIGVDKDEDGVYYWTLDGEWLTDADGNKIPTSGKDGADGEDGEGGKAGMPELRIQGGYWYVSYDGGENWERLGRATGYDGTDGKDGQDGVDGDSWFIHVDASNPEYVVFTLADGTTFVVPRDVNTESTMTLAKAFAKGGTVTLTEDVTLTSPLVVAEGKTVVFDLDGNSLTIATGNAIINNGKLTIEGEGKIDATTDYAIRNTGSLTIMGDVEISGQGGITSSAGNIVINGGSYTATSNWSTGTYNHVLYAANTAVIINDGTFDGTIGGTNNAMIMVGPNADVTINGGEFKNVSGEISTFPPYICTYENGGKLTINDGEFYGGWRFNMQATTYINGGNFTIETDGQSFNSGNPHVLTISGGVFTKKSGTNDLMNPSTYVATGYHAIEQDGVYCVVPEGVGKYVEADSIDEIKTALESAGAAGAGSTVINLANGTYDMTNVNWTSIKVDGYHGADIVYVNGNGAVIKGLTSALFAGGFAGGSGIVIKDLTIEDAVMSATNDQGYGAFVNCADSMDEITLENCHLINSTIITPNDGADESRIGGLVGWTAGYDNKNDGPVDSYITIKNCSVIGCTLKGAGSIGAICGHAGANAATYTTIEDCVVKDNNLISTDDGGWRVGVVVGTANNGQCMIKNITESGNTLTQTGETAPTGEKRNYYGRFVPNGTGTLTIDGVAIQES